MRRSRVFTGVVGSSLIAAALVLIGPAGVGHAGNFVDENGSDFDPT